MSPVLSSSVPCQTPSNEMRAHRRQPPPPHPAFLSTSPPTSAPASGLHFPFSPRLQDVCVLAHLSESRPCGCWWLSLGLTPVTAPHNGPFPPTSLSSEWSSAHQTLMSSTHQKARKPVVALLWLHAQRRHFQTYVHTRRTHGWTRTQANRQTNNCNTNIR